MNIRQILPVFLYLFFDNAVAAQPPEAIIDACLNQKNGILSRYAPITTNKQNVEEDADGMYIETTFLSRGRKIGYIARKDGDGLIWGKVTIPLISAKPFNAPPDEPSEFTPVLADWSYIQGTNQRYLCINFNFDGIGRSGSFQNVHGLYLMQIPRKPKQKPELYFGVRKIN